MRNWWIRQRSYWIPPNQFCSNDPLVRDGEQVQGDGVLPTLQLWTELQVPWMEPCTVYGLGDDVWNKSHRSVWDEQKVSPSALEELNEPEPFPDLDKLHCHPQSRLESKERRLQ